jgi:hypothetical protein
MDFVFSITFFSFSVVTDLSSEMNAASTVSLINDSMSAPL